ncbi:MAG: TPM domain-containing protein [Limisphaerales bacterium]
MTRNLVIFWLTLCCVIAQAKEVIPPAPKNHFDDEAHVISPGTATQLNNELAQFERDTGNQFVVAIYPKMQTDSSIEDYAVRIFRSWGVGSKEKNNGVVLFIFIQDHKLFIQTGYGLEGALPDVLCKRIIENEIVPRFKQADFNGGVTAGVHAVIAATKGEYKGTGRTVAEQRGGRSGNQSSWPFVLMLLFILFPILIARSVLRRGYAINSRGYSGGFWTGGMSSGGGWSGGGGGFGGGGGSFSGGGGSTGGGGAGGSW